MTEARVQQTTRTSPLQKQAKVVSCAVLSDRPIALLIFVALAFGLTWGLWLLSFTLTTRSPALGAALLLAAGFGPSLAAVALVLSFNGGSGLRLWLRRCSIGRLQPKWNALPVFGPPMTIVVDLGIHAALGGSVPASPAAGHIGQTLMQFGLILFTGGPVGEEFGWRGYALPALTTQVGWRWASLIVGAVWGLWHLPLFFIPGMAHAQMPMALFMTSAEAVSVVMAQRSVNAGFSVLPALLFHWAINAWPSLLPIIPMGGSIRPYVMVMSVFFVVAVVVFLKPGQSLSQGSLRQ